MGHRKFYSKLTFWSWFPLYFFMLLQAGLIHGEELAFDSSWQFTTTHIEDSDNVESFNQRYGLGWSSQVTRAIFFDFKMNYSKRETTGDIVRESFSPTGILQIENDLFFVELSGLLNQTKNSKSSDQLDRSLEAILASNWDYYLWPTLSFSLGQNQVSDDEQVHITDTSRQWAEFVTEWKVDTFDAYYSYYNELRDDFVEETSYDEKKHFGRVDYVDSFLSNKVNVSLSGQLTDSSSELDSSADDGSDISVKMGLSKGLAGIDTTPLTGSLPSVPTLIDGNKNDIVFTVNFHEVANLGVKADLKQVDNLYVYTGQLDPLLISETASLRWDLYSSEDGVNWKKEKTNPLTLYNRDKYRYEVSVGGLQRIYLKLVVTAWPALLNVPITEIEAYRTQTSTGDNVLTNEENTRTLSDLSFRYTPTTNTSLIYSLVYDDSENNTGNDSRRIFQTGSLRWWYSDYFTPSITINNTSTTNSDISDTEKRSYALNLKSILLPTLETNFGVTRNENSTDDVWQTRNHTINLNISATLYPDLDTVLDINKIFNDNEETDSSSETLGVRWTLTAHLSSSLLADFVLESGNTETSSDVTIDSTKSGQRYTLNINWRPSDLFSVLANGSRGYGEQYEDYEKYLLDTNLSLLRTSKTQITVGYKINATEDETLNSFNGDWSWKISEFFTMQTRGSYLLSEKNSWYISARLTSKF